MHGTVGVSEGSKLKMALTLPLRKGLYFISRKEGERLNVINGLLSQNSRQLFQSCWLFASQEDGSIHIADDGIGIIFVNCLELALCLQHQTGRDFTASDGGHQLFQLRNLPDVTEAFLP